MKRLKPSASVTQITGGGGCPTYSSVTCSPGVPITWPALSLAAGATQSFTVGSQVASNTADGTLIHNLASVTYVGGTISQGRDVVAHH